MGLLHVPWTPIQLPHLGRHCSPWLGSLCSLVLIGVPPFFSTISCLASSMKPSLVAPHQITRCSQPNRLKKKGESSRSSQYLPSVFSPKVLSKSSSSRFPLQINLYFLSPRNFLQELKTFFACPDPRWTSEFAKKPSLITPVGVDFDPPLLSSPTH